MLCSADHFQSLRPRQMAEISHVAKCQIFSDSHRLASSQSSFAAKAGFQAALAHATGFGTTKNQERFLGLVKNSSEKGHPLATALLPFLVNSFYKDGPNHSQEYSQALVSAFKHLLEQFSLADSHRERAISLPMLSCLAMLSAPAFWQCRLMGR